MQAAQSPSLDALVVVGPTSTTLPHPSAEPASSSAAVRRKASVKKLHGAIAGNGSASQEALMGLASGLAFGLVTPVVGHPGDVIKTQLQANAAHQHYTTTQTIRHIYHSQGLSGFYRGFFPPLVGTALTRGILFSTYSGVYSACSHSPLLSSEIPFSSGLGLNVVLGGIAAGSARAVVETPLEFIKVRSIVGKSAAMNGTATGASFVASSARDFALSPLATARHMYHGFVPTLLRSVGVCGSFFVLVDYSVRFLPDVINSPYGAFFKGGVCATAAWTLAFPFETAKSVIQADATGQYKNMRGATAHVLRNLYQERGLVKGWYRGFVPGAGRSFVANGCSMMVYSWFQDAIRDHFDNEA